MIDPFKMNLRHLTAVSAAGQFGSISAASHALNMSQPALTQAVGKVEAQIGHLLFHRVPSGVVPTEAGQLMMVRIQRATGYLSQGGQSVRRSARLPVLPNIERRMTLGQLRALIAVEAAGSYALASAGAALSEPALHRAVRELEHHLGVKLMARRGRTVQPTPAAGRLLRHARLARAELQAGLDELAALQTAGAGRVTVGTMPFAHAVLLPQALARFARAFPSATVVVVEGPYAELLSTLRNGDSDLLIGALRDPLPVADVVQEALLADEPVIAARAGHPLAGRTGDFQQLLAYRWVVPGEGTPARQRWEAMFTTHGLHPPRLHVECGSLLVTRGLLLEDDWLTLLSPDQFLFERRAGLIVEIEGATDTLRREIGLTWRRDWCPTAAQAAFAATFRDVCADWTSGKAMAGKPFRYG